jgi:hypothetical protein
MYSPKENTEDPNNLLKRLNKNKKETKEIITPDKKITKKDQSKTRSIQDKAPRKNYANSNLSRNSTETVDEAISRSGDQLDKDHETTPGKSSGIFSETRPEETNFGSDMPPGVPQTPHKPRKTPVRRKDSHSPFKPQRASEPRQHPSSSDLRGTRQESALDFRTRLTLSNEELGAQLQREMVERGLLAPDDVVSRVPTGISGSPSDRRRELGRDHETDSSELSANSLSSSNTGGNGRSSREDQKGDIVYSSTNADESTRVRGDMGGLKTDSIESMEDSGVHRTYLVGEPGWRFAKSIRRKPGFTEHVTKICADARRASEERRRATSKILQRYEVEGSGVIVDPPRIVKQPVRKKYTGD